MLRLVGFFVLAVLLAQFLAVLPVVGPIFQRAGCLGIWVAALLLSWAFTKIGERAVQLRRDGSEIRRLSAVDSPYNQGKLGSLYLAHGRVRRSVEPLEAAARGEPDVPEWSYRLGTALLRLRRFEEASEALRRCVALDEEYAYGAAQMRLAEALAAQGRHRDALDALAAVERNHGPSPESAFRRGAAYKALGEKDEAHAAFAEVSKLAADAARYQRKSAGLWSAKAQMAKFF